MVVSLSWMDDQAHAYFEARAKVLKTLAHASRLFIVEELSRGERCVCELTSMVGADISTVSKHLALLKSAGIVADRKRGMQVFYRLKTRRALGFLDCVGDLLMENSEELQRIASTHLDTGDRTEEYETENSHTRPAECPAPPSERRRRLTPAVAASESTGVGNLGVTCRGAR